MSKRNSKQSFKTLKKMRIRFWKINPKCYYCQTITVLPTDIPNLESLIKSKQTPNYMATIEHLYTRYDKERFEEGGIDKCVLSCFKCNQDKEIERANLVSKEEKQRKSNRYPSEI